MNIIKLSITRPTVVVVIFTILVVFGIFSYNNLNQELMPSISMPTLTVSTVYPGAGPSEVESSVSKKIEDAISSVESIESMNTISMEGFSLIVIEFKMGTDINLSAQNVQRKINAIRSELPDDVKESSVETFDISDSPIMNMGVTAQMGDKELYDLVDNDIKSALERIPGVARINMIGGREREIQVNLNEQRLASYNLTISDVTQILISSNLDFPTGKIDNGEKQVLIRLAGKYQSVEDINDLVVEVFPDGSIVKMKDIAYVSDTEKKVSSISRVDGTNAIGISVQKQADANAVIVSETVKEVLKEAEAKYQKENLSFHIVQNSSDFTIESTKSVVFDLVLAILFVGIAMLFFLHSLRNALIATIAIPASLISTLLVMYLSGFTLNMMTLIALSLVVGILVDDAIVVIENIHRHLEMGKSKLKATYDGVREISMTIVSITLVIVVVFIPITLTQSLISEVFRQFAVVVATATLFSLFVCFTIVPLLSSRFAKLEQLNTEKFFGKFITRFEKVINAFAKAMTNTLKWSFNHKLIVFGVTIALFISSIALLGTGLIGSEFADAGDRGEFYIRLELPKDATIEQTNQLTWQAEDIIRANSQVSSIITTVGYEEDGQIQSNKSEILVKMRSYKERILKDKELALQIKLLLQKEVVGAKITSIPTSLFGGADDSPIQFYVIGDNLESVLSTADSIVNRMNLIIGVSDPKVSIESGNPEIQIELNREKMSRLGVPLIVLGEAMNNAFSGNTDAKFRDRDKEYDINIRLDQHDRKGIEDIENFSVQNLRGEQIKLKQIANIIETDGPSRLERRNRSTSVSISCQAVGRPSGDIGEDIKLMIDQSDLPESVFIEYGGDMKNQDDGFGTLGMALLISIMLVYLIMVLLYDNYIYPFVVLFSIPFALIGALFALALTMETLSIFSMMGIIMLIGLVAKNAIIVIDFTNQLVLKGIDVKEALLEATQERFRPILMTTIAMIVGMLPIALASGPGAEWKNSLGWVLIGGLTSSMFLTLIVVPLVYYLFERLLSKFGLNKKEEKICIED